MTDACDRASLPGGDRQRRPPHPSSPPRKATCVPSTRATRARDVRTEVEIIG